MTEKKGYESPKAEKLEFDFKTTVTASNPSFGAGNDQHGEDGEQLGYVWASGTVCTVYNSGDECFGC